MNYNLLTQSEQNAMTQQYLHDLEANIYRQELLTIAEPANSAAAAKLASLKASYDAQATAIGTKFPALTIADKIQ